QLRSGSLLTAWGQALTLLARAGNNGGLAAGGVGRGRGCWSPAGGFVINSPTERSRDVRRGGTTPA
ncbi:MAG TPA: hypothetical protein PKC18_20065, partial [Lacipirellulaceae bacterium]|nr:hypothetical protein [Lacipirellulaceae bacterium]